MQIVERSRGMMTYDEERKDITFLERELANTSENWRARILTTQDSQNLENTGTIQPISLPDGLEDTENVRSWCQALRLCGHDMRRVYARKAIQAGCMPHALLQYTARNAYGALVRRDAWVSSPRFASLGHGHFGQVVQRSSSSRMRNQKMALTLRTFSKSNWRAPSFLRIFFRNGAKT